jgi:[ribosomal protein S5]-alanine N-acetyltransferase
MPNVQLIVPPRALDDALSSDPEYNEAMSSEDWGRLANAIQRVLARTPLTPSPDSPRDPWGGYFAVDEDTHEVVGSCAFKTPPTAEGSVEIAYFTYPPFEGRGYATEMARRLVEMATQAGTVGSVIAHTLPEPSASTRVLEKAGLAFVGEVIDPEDGRVWRWNRRIGEQRT